MKFPKLYLTSCISSQTQIPCSGMHNQGGQSYICRMIFLHIRKIYYSSNGLGLSVKMYENNTCYK